MNRFGTVFFLVITSFMVIVFNSCTIETAQPSSDKHLIVLSDYLTMSDTTIFSEFIQLEKVSLEIINMEADKIIGLMRNQGDNVQADLIMVRSLFDVYRMQKRGIQQQIHFEEELSPAINNISSSQFNFVGFGLDPFIIANPNGTQARTYNDLLRIKHINLLSKRELIPMLAPISSKLKKVKGNKWIKDFTDNEVSRSLSSDSSFSLMPILTTYSNYINNKDTLLDFDNRFLTYPNSRSSGSFYNVRSFSIVKQAQKYSIAKSFILFYTTDSYNLKLNKKLDTFSILDDSSSFRRYKEWPDKLMHYYQTIDRVLQRIE